MVITTDFAIAFRGIYGSFDFSEITLFNLEKANKDFNNFLISRNQKQITIDVKCPICSKHHYYKYNLSEISNKSLIIGGCEEVGVPIFYFGKSCRVHEKIERLNQINKEILAMI